MKKLKVGDSVKFKNGVTGVVEDYDDQYYYIKDKNCNNIKIKKVKDSEMSSQEYLDYLKTKILPIAEKKLSLLQQRVDEAYELYPKYYNKAVEYVINFCKNQKDYEDDKTGISIVTFYNDQFEDKTIFNIQIWFDEDDENYNMVEENKETIENEIFKDFSWDDNLLFSDAWENDTLINKRDFDR